MKMKLFFAEMDIRGYSLRVVSETEEGAMKALKQAYYEWKKQAKSMGSMWDTWKTFAEDNGIHVGIDTTWPGTGERVQFCSGKNQWTWSSAQRDSGSPPSSCGVPNTITLDVPSAGEHVISFSMREDGFEFDKWIMTDDVSYDPTGAGPPEVEYTGN
jgi:hypothetical protein